MPSAAVGQKTESGALNWFQRHAQVLNLCLSLPQQFGRHFMSKGLVFCLSLIAAALCQVPGTYGATNLARIGYLEPSNEGASAYRAFQQGMRDLGYLEGKNLLLEYRSSTIRGRFRELARELAQLKVDVLVARAGGPVRAAQSTSATVPVVFAFSGDPIEAGFVESLARPQSNMTGVSYLAYELIGKRLEILKEAMPLTSVVAVLANPSHAGEKREFSETQRAAQALHVELRYHRVRNMGDFAAAFEAIVKEKANAVLVFPETVTFAHRTQIAEFAAKRRLPTIFGWKEFVEDGGLMSYGPKREDTHTRLAVFVNKILKGRKPADLPVELPMKFELVVNLQTAKAIGVSVEPNVLARADRVIR